jgi:hypothetical protein
LAPAFSERALRDAEKYVETSVRTLLKHLTEGAGPDGWSEPKTFSQWTTFFGFDFISDLSFGSSLELMENKDNRSLVNALIGANKFLYYVSLLGLHQSISLSECTTNLDSPS